MNTPPGLRYTQSDEWILENDGVVTVGITDYAQHELGEIVYVELPEIGANLASGAALGVVESVKSVGDLHCPVAGEVLEVNVIALKNPSLINTSPYESGWLARLRVAPNTDFSALMDAAAYAIYRAGSR